MALVSPEQLCGDFPIGSFWWYKPTLSSPPRGLHVVEYRVARTSTGENENYLRLEDVTTKKLAELRERQLADLSPDPDGHYRLRVVPTLRVLVIDRRQYPPLGSWGTEAIIFHPNHFPNDRLYLVTRSHFASAYAVTSAESRDITAEQLYWKTHAGIRQDPLRMGMGIAIRRQDLYRRLDWHGITRQDFENGEASLTPERQVAG